MATPRPAQLPVLAGPFLHEATATSVTIWFATGRPLARSGCVLEIWDPAPFGILTHPEPVSPFGTVSMLKASSDLTSLPVIQHLHVHRVCAPLRLPLRRGRVIAYRLRLGDQVIAPPGTYPRLDPPPRARGPTATFASFVVPTETSWWLIAARDLAPAGNDLERRRARFAASYLLGSSPALLAAYLPAPDERLSAAVGAAARLMANLTTQLLDEPAPRREARADGEARRAVYGAFGGIAEPTRRTRVASRPAIACVDPGGDPATDLALDRGRLGLIVSAAPIGARDPDKLARGVAREIARHDETIVLCLAPGTGYLATPAPAPEPTAPGLPRGRRYEVAIPGDGSIGAPSARDLVVTPSQQPGTVSAHRAGDVVTITLAAAGRPLSHEIRLPPGRLQPLSRAAPGLWIGSRVRTDTDDLLAHVLVRLVVPNPMSDTHLGLSRALAEARPGGDGHVGWDLSRVPEGTYQLRLDGAESGRRMRGARHLRALQGQRFEIELERGEILSIDHEPVPGPAFRLLVDPLWLRVHKPVGAHGGSKWQPVFGREGEHSTTGNQVVPLVDGGPTFDAMFAAIRHATRSNHFVYLLGWWFATIKELPDLVAAVAQRGVQVRLLLWRNPGRLLANYVTKKVFDDWPDSAVLVDELTASGFGSHHQKLMLVSGDDGLTAFVGGIDWNRDRIEAPDVGRGQPMHDVHVQIRGPAAHDLLEVFVGRWHHHPGHADVEDPSRRRPKRPLLAMREVIPVDRPGTTLVRAVETFNVVHSSAMTGILFRRDACQYTRSQHDALFAAIKAAEKYIYIEDQYLVSIEVASCLCDALRRVKHVTILIPGNAVSDLPQATARRCLSRPSPQGTRGGAEARGLSAGRSAVWLARGEAHLCARQDLDVRRRGRVDRDGQRQPARHVV